MLGLKLAFASVLAIAFALDYDCPSDGQYFYKYPYDCSKFIECNRGKAQLTDCIIGLEFSEEQSYCDFPSNANCVEEEKPEPEPEECPLVNGQFPVFLPDKTSCSRYYECDWGRPILMSCPAGLFFNTLLNVCDYPQDSGCVEA